MWNQTTKSFAKHLKSLGARRAYVVRRPNGGLVTNDPSLNGFAEQLSASPDFRNHQACFFEVGKRSGNLLGAFVHNTCRGQAAGGVRYWTYGDVAQFATDGLRLSRGMSEKCALAGLWWGGGKGVIAREPGDDYRDKTWREKVFRDYGDFITGLSGVYVTAEDVGTTPADIDTIFQQSRHVTCISPALGGSGNPSRLTAEGVVVAMEAALHHSDPSESLHGKTIAMQGAGHVARFMIEPLLERGVAKIVAADIDTSQLQQARSIAGSDKLELREVSPTDQSILAEDCHIVAPNAVGATLNPQTIPTIRAPIVCGAANNQLADAARDGLALKQRGIVYVPDFLANRMGIVGCANEQYGAIPNDPMIERHLDRDTPYGVYQRTREVLRMARDNDQPPAEEANRLAQTLMQQPHPVWPDRGQQIIDSLVRNGWGVTPTQ